MHELSDKKVLLGVTGSIAAYKAVVVARRLVESGAVVQVVMTEAAQRFISSMTLAAVTGNPVRDSLWDERAELAMGHIELARWADAVLVAPASADTLARLAQGRADDLLTTLCLATKARVAVAPAMNHVMWHHPATRRNVDQLRDDGVMLVGPDQGALAEREMGIGRMTEPEGIVEQLTDMLAMSSTGDLEGYRVVITAGPTREPLDPVRYLTNRSSGKMGYALASACREAGATVVLVSGPTELAHPHGVEVVSVESAAQMHEAVMSHVSGADIFIGAAAVADYRPAQQSADKIKKRADDNQLLLTRTHDIIADVTACFPNTFTLGFAAETQAIAEQARAKRQRKKLSMIAGNLVGPDAAFDQEENELLVIWDGGERHLQRASKSRLARELIALVAELHGHS